MLSNKDLRYLNSRKISKQNAEKQLENFKKGFSEIQLIRPASINDGIITNDEEAIDKYTELFDYRKNLVSVVKMVPASGAASRMFKDLLTFRETFTGSEEEFLEFRSKRELGSMCYFFENIQVLPFYTDLKDALMEKGLYIEKLLEKNDYRVIIDELLFGEYLGYENLPKALLKFHCYKSGERTPLEEHLVETANYCNNSKNISRIHFTVSEEHLKNFQKHIKRNRKKYEQKYNTKFNVSFSIQKHSTDTIAVYENGKIVRDENGKPLLRPGGHGALIENLNDIKADIVFIKNIDNVAPDRLKDCTYKYSKYLGGILFDVQGKIFEYLKMLSNTNFLHADKIDEIMTFCSEELCIRHPKEIYYKNREELISYLQVILNRPIRVCGMVENEGEPGGGPFWVKNEDGSESLQIIEKSQINTDKKEQKDILEKSTHFNPVNIVCGIRDYKGKKFDLREFVKQDWGIITQKTYQDKKIKVQELPGLWNGGMAHWISLFVEIPAETFTPVKTVHDLFKIEHRNLLSNS